jgi:hypothetical protein
LFKQTTFFPSQDVPVYMSDFEEETTTGSCHNISTAEYDTKMEGVREDGLSVSVTDWTIIFRSKGSLLV